MYLLHVPGLTWLSLWHPELVLLCVLLYLLYWYATYRVRPELVPAAAVSSGQQIGFILYLTVGYVAMGSPLAAAAQLHGFTYFVLQMLLMTMVMPWLLLLTIPVWLIDSSLQFPIVRRIVQWLTYPLVATGLYNLITTAFLIPAVFDANLQYNWLHVLDQSIMMVLGVFLWWPLSSQSTVLPQARKGVQLFYILFSVNLMMPIVVLLLIAHSPWYSMFQHTSWPVSWSLLADQQAGAILMFIGMALAYGIRALSVYRQYDTSKWYE